MNGKKSIRSLTGVRRDSEVMYVGTYDTQPQHLGRRGKISDVWGTLSKSQSTPDLLGERVLYDEEEEDREEESSNVAKDTAFLQEPASIFNRPGFGSVAFRRAVGTDPRQSINRSRVIGVTSTPLSSFNLSIAIAIVTVRTVGVSFAQETDEPSPVVAIQEKETKK